MRLIFIVTILHFAFEVQNLNRAIIFGKLYIDLACNEMVQHSFELKKEIIVETFRFFYFH